MSRMASTVAIVRGERGSARVASIGALSVSGGMGNGAMEEAGDSLERLTEVVLQWPGSQS